MSDDRTLSVSGMSCTGCETNVEDALEALDGVDVADADHQAGTVSLTLAASVAADEIERAVSDAGYTVEA
jgi:copper chaperone